MQGGRVIRKKPERLTGLAHLFAAARYSAAGISRLWQEAAFRHEALGGALGLVMLAGLGATLGTLAIFALLLLLLFCVEALNTAIEEIVDHLSPEWSQFAKNAKDLGSAAVFFLLLANGGFFVLSVARLLL